MGLSSTTDAIPPPQKCHVTDRTFFPMFLHAPHTGAGTHAKSTTSPAAPPIKAYINPSPRILIFHLSSIPTHTNPHSTPHHTMPSGQSNSTPSNRQHNPPAEAVPSFPPPESESDESWVWSQIKAEARRDAESEPALASFLYATVLSHQSLPRSLSFHLANKLCSSTLLSTLLYDLFVASFSEHPTLRSAAVADLLAAKKRDPACASFSHCLLNYKGFLAIQAHRVSHVLWSQNRKPLALAVQSRIADVFAVNIHPAARFGEGIFLDHATGVVIGETAVIGNNVSMLHHVTLGGTGKDVSNRHPKIADGVLIGAGATILGNIKIGEGARIETGSLVLIDVPARTTAVGNPARLIGRNNRGEPVKNEDDVFPGETMDHTSFIQQWCDFII